MVAGEARPDLPQQCGHGPLGRGLRPTRQRGQQDAPPGRLVAQRQHGDVVAQVGQGQPRCQRHAQADRHHRLGLLVVVRLERHRRLEARPVGRPRQHLGHRVRVASDDPALLGEFRHTDLAATGEPVPRGHHDLGRVLQQLGELEVGVLDARPGVVPQQGHLDPAPLEVLEQLLEPGAEHLEAHPGVALVEAGHRHRQQRRRDGREGPQPQRAGPQPGDVVQLALQRRQLVVDRRHVAHDRVAGIRQSHATRMAFEHRLPHLGLQAAHLLGDRGGGVLQVSGRTGHRAPARDGCEDSEPVHVQAHVAALSPRGGRRS